MWSILLILLSTIYILNNLVLPNYIDGFINSYVIRPILWIILTIIILIFSKREGINIWYFNKARRWEIGRNPFEAALLIGGFHVSILVISGLYFGFGSSPYSFQPRDIILNIFFVLSALIGIELSRSYLIKKGTTKRKKLTLNISLVALLFFIISIQLNEFLTLDSQNLAPIAKFIGETIIPLFAISLLASYLSYLGGALTSIGYLGIIQAFHWFSPILPNLEWGIAALIGTLVPAVGFLIIANSMQIRKKTPFGKTKKRKKENLALSWTAVAAICLVIVFFSIGFFGAQPTVIYSGSMKESLDIGDIVLVSKIPTDEIKVGDIIQYQTSDMYLPVIHRVYDIYKENNSLYFVTKGDANNLPDSDPVFQENVFGKVIYKIPKIGWITIIFKDMLNKIGIKL